MGSSITSPEQQNEKNIVFADCHALNTEIERLNAENKVIKMEVSKLSRELRINKDLLDKVSQMVDAKEALGQVLTAANTKQKAYTEMLLENCPNIMFLLDDEGYFVLSTNALPNEMGLHNFDFIKGRTYESIFSKHLSPCVAEQLCNKIKDVYATKKTDISDEWIDFKHDGNLRCYTVELIYMDAIKGKDAGISSGILAVLVDITDYIREKNRAENASNAKSDFLATMSHEIRTPMNAVMGMTEMLIRSDPTPKQTQYINNIHNSSKSLLSIINDILDFSKIEAGKLTIVNQNYNLRDMLKNLFNMFNYMFSEKGLSFNFNTANTLPERVVGDEVRLRQILTNLLSNALKYTQEGFVSFAAWLSEDNMLRFDIHDSGIGIRKEDIPKLFKPFEQLDMRKNKNVVGTGLGLAISYQLCRLMDGQMLLKSTYGEGSLFSVSVPYVLATENVLAEENEEIVEFVATGARVLVVDDIEINLIVADTLLNIFDIRPDLAHSGAEAITLTRKNTYDAVFMDHMMPEMDGIEAVKLIRAQGKQMPIIALTANAISGMREMYLENQFDDYLSKPLEIDCLNQCLRKWLPGYMIQNL